MALSADGGKIAAGFSNSSIRLYSIDGEEKPAKSGKKGDDSAAIKEENGDIIDGESVPAQVPSNLKLASSVLNLVFHRAVKFSWDIVDQYILFHFLQISSFFCQLLKTELLGSGALKRKLI